MSDQEAYAVIGKAREDYRSAKKELAALEDRAEQLAGYAVQIQRALSEPDRIVFFSGTPTYGRVLMLTDAMFDQLSATNVKKLAADMKRVKQTKEALRKRLIELEGEDPEAHSARG